MGRSLVLLVAPPILVFLTLAYGHYRLTQTTHQKEDDAILRTTIVQGNIDQSVKWNPAYQDKTIQSYENLTVGTISFRPNLVVWPETALPFFFQDKSSLSKKVITTIRKMGCPFVFGSPAYGGTKGNIRYYNRAYLLSPRGSVMGTYDKVHLVPFGEYVPLKRFLPFVHRLVPAAGDFSSGENSDPLPLSPFPPGVLICYEAIFPELARSRVRHGAALLINLTNDAWFGSTSAPYQHLAMSVFRAVETGRPLIRAANTGFSAVVDSQGRILKQSGLFSEEVLTVKVPLGRREMSPYTRFGDLFALVLLGITFLCGLFCAWRFIKGGKT
jgi:apolipoprotein N-acyltransferase